MLRFTFILAILLSIIPFTQAEPLPITGEEKYSLIRFLFKHQEEFTTKHNLFPDGYVSNIANDALKPGTKRDGYLTNMLEVQSYNTVNHLMRFNKLPSLFALSPIRCKIDKHFRFDGEDCLKEDLKPVQITVRETYGHRLYTPKTELYKGLDYAGANEKIVNPAEFDRPFAAWSYYNKILEINHGLFQHRHTTSFGMVGEAAMGRAVQEWAHKYPFSGPQKIQGWETQVDHRIALQYQNKLTFNTPTVYDPLNVFGASLHLNTYFDYGNIIKSFGLGVGANLSVGGSRHCIPHEWAFVGKSINNDSIPKEDQKDLDKREDPFTCFNIEPWLVFDVELRRDRVRFNYLIEDGIHVPANVITQEELDLYNSIADNDDLPPINPILVTGGELRVTLEPTVDTFTMGVTAFDMLRVGYMKRTEETIEQDEKHEWLEVQVNIKGDDGWLFLPLFLTYRSWQK